MASSYLYNKRFGYHNGSSWVYSLRRLTRAREAARVPVLADGRSSDYAMGFEPTTYYLWGYGHLRHLDWKQGNVVCLDGHVEKMIWGQVAATSFDWVASE